MALSDKGTAGNGEWMDVSLGTMPNVTADLIRKAFYPVDEHVADAAAASLTDRRFLCCWGPGGRGAVTLLKIIEADFYSSLHQF